MLRNENEIRCQKCNLYLGAIETCPNCRNRIGKRRSIRLLKYYTPVLAVVALFILYQIGISIGNPNVKISSLDPRYNYAYIELSGLVISQLYFYPKERGLTGTIEFSIDDGTGIIEVKAYEDVTSDLIKLKKIPSIGDNVKLKGTYHIKGKKESIILGSEKQLRIERKVPLNYTKIKEIAKGDEKAFQEYTKVKILGNVSGINFTSYSIIVNVEEESYIVSAIYYWSTLELYGIVKPGERDWKTAPKIGDCIEAVGALKYEKYGEKGYWLFYPNSPLIQYCSEGK
ncbi:MAG: hypothetical protein AB1779_09530 [Candidatus Thermoplasmatota archaeon]